MLYAALSRNQYLDQVAPQRTVIHIHQTQPQQPMYYAQQQPMQYAQQPVMAQPVMMAEPQQPQHQAYQQHYAQPVMMAPQPEQPLPTV